jgi:hypothetical protein
LSEQVKQRTIKLFLRALTYDEIAGELGISHGSVAKVVEDFRDGKLPFPSGMTEYVDTLRRLAVDLRKNDTSVDQIKGYIEVHIKLRQMGATKDKVLDWLETCQELSKGDVSTKELIESAIELKRLSSRNKLSYAAIVADYEAKLAMLGDLNREIKVTERAMSDLKSRYEAEEERKRETLDAISRAIAVATNNLEKQRKELDGTMKEHLARNKLSWKRIKLVEAILDTALGDSRLTRKQQDKIKNEIARAASVTREINELVQKKNSLEVEISHLIEMKRAHAESVDKLGKTEGDLSKSVFWLSNTKAELDSQVAAATVQLNDINKEIDEKSENFYMTHLILDFLFDPQSVTNEDFSVLTNMMNIIRNNRLGIQPRQSTGGQLTIKYKGRLPIVYRNLDKHNVNVYVARKTFAYLLALECAD